MAPSNGQRQVIQIISLLPPSFPQKLEPHSSGAAPSGHERSVDRVSEQRGRCSTCHDQHVARAQQQRGRRHLPVQAPYQEDRITADAQADQRLLQSSFCVVLPQALRF